jgi:cytochrome c
MSLRFLSVVGALIVVGSLAGAPQAENAEKLIQASDCSSCHAVDHQVVGPAYGDIAKRYAGQSDAVEKLAAKVRDGGPVMTPHPYLTDAQRRAMVEWILSQKDSAAPSQGTAQTAAKLYAYKLKDGTSVQLDFPLMVDGSGQKVTKDVFHGYQLWNSYCYRCHGTDATGGQLAPDLRRSLAAGMKQPEFLAVTMAGRKEKGMPSWAGFLSEKDVTDVYKYAKGRSLELVPVGRPPSEQD